MTTENPLSYTNYDWDDMVTDLQNRLKAGDAWKDTYESSTGQMLIELLAYVGNLITYYIERHAEESYLETAQHKSSVINLVKLINYLPKRKSSATGTLTFSLPVAPGKIVYIPKYTECQTANGTKYLTNEAVTITPTATSVDASSIQGELVSLEFVSDGSSDQKFNINDTSVENSADSDNPTLVVTVDGTVWTQVTSFIASTNTSTHYRVIQELDDTISIQFGNNIKGKIPDFDSTIAVQYVKSEGLDGNVYQTGSVTTINDTIYDEDGDEVSSITVTNSTLLLGGDNAEDIDEIKYEAPRVFSTGERAVTKTDFIAILENYPDVVNANVWGEKEEADAAGVDADVTMLNKIKISLLLQNWELPDSAFKTTISNYLYDLSMIAIKYEFVDPTIINVIPVLDVKVVSGNTLSQTQTAIESELASQFSLGDTTKIGTMIKYSNVLSALNNLSAVSYLNMVLEIRQDLESDYNSGYDFGAILNATAVKPETVKVYVGTNQVAEDSDNGDGTGTLVDLSSGYTVSGTVNYNTGEILVDISPSVSSIYVRYQQDEDGNIIVGFNEICKLYDTEFTSIAIET